MVYGFVKSFHLSTSKMSIREISDKRFRYISPVLSELHLRRFDCASRDPGRFLGRLELVLQYFSLPEFQVLEYAQARRKFRLLIEVLQHSKHFEITSSSNSHKSFGRVSLGPLLSSNSLEQ